MKISNKWKKNLVAGAVLLTVCSGIYLNWVYAGGQDTKNLEDTLPSDKVMSDTLLDLGDNSVQVDNDQTNTVTDYFAAVRLSRQEARDSAVNLLQEAMSYGDEAANAQTTAQLEQIIQISLSKHGCHVFLGFAGSLTIVLSILSGESPENNIAGLLVGRDDILAAINFTHLDQPFRDLRNNIRICRH